MKNPKLIYIYLLVIHAAIAVLVFILPFTSKIYALSICAFGLIYIVKNKNKNNEVLIMSAYVITVEVFLRMTNGAILNEFGKYAVILFMFIGIIYSGFSNRAFIYWIFFILLIPSVILSVFSLNMDTDIRKAIVFNISGPVCLGISSIYCFQRRITFDRLKVVITALALPLVSIAAYLFMYSPSVKDVVRGTDSNFATSGGFGPNQVSTILGLGIFVFFVQLLLNSKSKLLIAVNGFLVLVFAFRGIVTFSRGGVMTGIVMIVLLLIVLYKQGNVKSKAKVGLVIILTFLAGVGVWGYSSMQTSGLINKRYANQDAAGREKKSKLSGREVLIASEFQMFLDNPILGVGVGKNKEIREEETGIEAASHNEITRMMAEHGTLGIIDLLILLFTPLLFFVNNRQNVFVLSFWAFWLLTINHAAMRLAAPAFIYALALLSVQINIPEKPEHSLD
ncbi:O-antigen ligase family protein [Flavobacterium sp. Fl-318]|uniref:O-antigen ligase family protein n=1 Tax=Flavobacterium cupriresistens TaxID=2893885 RepID=A0ABU4RF35_9FLAO|nr:MULTISPECIES: O-antigen ligase family protein [unclassified Flavobacterium]MDX6190075.1 O-antigen ligase family protein [Flavobacterium sp. Fl-318]UFH42898.1 O-antigen ligase family protein [Flavobacterium sp. F-323]